MDIHVKRVYDKPAPTDGRRVLVDRLWPRGLKKEDARIDLWLKEIAPSGELRQWFGHDPDRFEEFRRRYSSELAEHESKLQELRQRAKDGTLTLVYGARDTEHNDAVVLAEVMRTVA